MHYLRIHNCVSAYWWRAQEPCKKLSKSRSGQHLDRSHGRPMCSTWSTMKCCLRKAAPIVEQTSLPFITNKRVIVSDLCPILLNNSTIKAGKNTPNSFTECPFKRKYYSHLPAPEISVFSAGISAKEIKVYCKFELYDRTQMLQG